jgi:hypothetical protein
MKKMKEVNIEHIDSRKAIIIEFEDKETRSKKLGFIQDFEDTDGRIVMNVKPLVYKASFEGNQKLTLYTNLKKFKKMIKQFESSESEILFLSRNKGYGFRRKEFNEMLESVLHKMVTEKYWQELHKELKKSYVV